jgi:uncharacterized protein
MSARFAHDPSGTSSNPSNLCALAIMTKAPRAGEVKTRLIPPLTPTEAAEINSCFLRDLATSISHTCRMAPARGVAVYTPAGTETGYQEILPSDFLLLAQRGADFGERLFLAAEDLFTCGFGSVCLINSDSPTVPAACFAEAANVLAKDGDRLAIGPSDDGGYYLIGMKKPHRRIFEQIDWSTDRVFEQTKQRTAELGLEIHELPAGFDVDDPAGLARLCNELLDENVSAGVAPNTRKFLSEIITREGRARIWPVMAGACA